MLTKLYPKQELKLCIDFKQGVKCFWDFIILSQFIFIFKK